MPHHVGHPLPHHPGHQRLGPRRQRRPLLAHRRLDPRGAQRGAGPVQLGGEGDLPVAGDRLADLGQRLAPDRLDVRDLRQRRLEVARRQPARRLRLDHHHRQRVAEQVVQVAGEPQPLLGDRGTGQLLPGLAQLADHLVQRQERGDQPARDKGVVAGGRGAPGVVAVPARDHSGGARQRHQPQPQPAAALDAAQRDGQRDEQQQPVPPVGEGPRVGDRGQRGQQPPRQRPVPGLRAEPGQDTARVQHRVGGQAGPRQPRQAVAPGRQVRHRARQHRQPGQQDPAARRPGRHRLAVRSLPGQPAPEGPFPRAARPPTCRHGRYRTGRS